MHLDFVKDLKPYSIKHIRSLVPMLTLLFTFLTGCGSPPPPPPPPPPKVNPLPPPPNPKEIHSIQPQDDPSALPKPAS